MILIWTIHDLVELDPVTLLLLVANVLALVLAISLRYPRGPCPIRGDYSSLVEPLGMNRDDVPEPARESRQDVAR